MKNFNFNMKSVRKSKGITQEQLAKTVNSTQAQISKYELNKEQPTLERLVEIAIALDVTLNDLIEIRKQQQEYSDKLKNL